MDTSILNSQDIERIMKQIVNIPELPVFRVELSRTDHTANWRAVATLRADQRGFSYHGETAIEALQGLYRVLLDSITCPHCGQRMPKKG